MKNKFMDTMSSIQEEIIKKQEEQRQKMLKTVSLPKEAFINPLTEYISSVSLSQEAIKQQEEQRQKMLKAVSLPKKTFTHSLSENINSVTNALSQ